MRKIVLSLIAFLTVCISVSAQRCPGKSSCKDSSSFAVSGSAVAVKCCDGDALCCCDSLKCRRCKPQKPRDWYLGVSAGAQVFDGMSDRNITFGERIAPVGGITVGKVMNNWFNLDASLSFAQFKGAYGSPADYKHFVTSKMVGTGSYRYQNGAYASLYVRAGFDLNTIFAGYKPGRKGSFVPYAGLGLSTGLGKCNSDIDGGESHSNFGVAPSFEYGLQYVYLFNRNIAGFADFHGSCVGKKLENEPCDEHFCHGTYRLKLGVLVNLTPGKFGKGCNSQKCK